MRCSQVYEHRTAVFCPKRPCRGFPAESAWINGCVTRHEEGRYWSGNKRADRGHTISVGTKTRQKARPPAASCSGKAAADSFCSVHGI